MKKHKGVIFRASCGAPGSGLGKSGTRARGGWGPRSAGAWGRGGPRKGSPVWVQRRDGAVEGALLGDTLEGGKLGAGSEGREGRKGPGGLGVSALRALVQGGVVGRRRRRRAEVPVGAEGDQEGLGPRAWRGGRGTCRGDAVSEPVPPKTLGHHPVAAAAATTGRAPT